MMEKELKAKATTEAMHSLMYQEAKSSSIAVSNFLASNKEKLLRIGEKIAEFQPRSIVTCARGSSDHAATYAKYLFEILHGIQTSSAALSVSSIFASPNFAQGTLCLAISQSGRSPDLLSAVKAQRDGGAFVIAIVNDESAPLKDIANETLFLKAGEEKSVAATKSFITSLIALVAISAHWRKDAKLIEELESVPQKLNVAFESDWYELSKGLKGANNLFVLGRGYSYGIAQEAALKLKETCGLHAEAYSAAEVQHGPMAIIRDGFPIISFACSDATQKSVLEVSENFASRGANVFLAANIKRNDCISLPFIAASAILEPIFIINSFYKAACTLAFMRGFNPDKPISLNKVTSTV